MRKTAMALLSLVLLSAAGTMLSACNTVRGVGEDTAAGGRAIERGATDVQRRM